MRVHFSTWLLGVLLFGVPFTAMTETISSKDFLEVFKNPPREYSSGPLWVWNDLLTEDEIRSTLHDLAGQGVRQAWVHPRPGLMTTYLEDDWFRLWKVALDEAHKLDMNIWIYDENSYPSGFAGGLVPEAMPESVGKGLEFEEVEKAPRGEDALVVFRLSDDGPENVTEGAREGTLADGRYLVARIVQCGTSPWFAGKTYVDLLKPGVTQKFLDITLEAYRKNLGDEFGKRIPGSFTDEPHLVPAGELHWTEDLPEVFQARWGYSLTENLASLALPVGDWKKVRHNYFQTLLDLFIERWAKPYHDYCEEHGLEFTGHYWEHEWPTARRAPDNMAMYAFHQRPAIDTLFNQYAEDVHSQFGNVRSVMELASVAGQTGHTRTLCETYGGCGWDVRFEDLKRIGDWLYVLGVNTLNEHLSHITLRGTRKADYPVSFSYHTPWWGSYHLSAEYFTRLSAALSNGVRRPDILMLEPTTSAWLYQEEPKEMLGPLGDDFQALVTRLAQDQVEFDLGSEKTLADCGAVEGSSLRVGEQVYSIVILPPHTENLNAETVGLLKGVLDSGGTVLACSNVIPTLVDGSPSSLPAEMAKLPKWESVETSALSEKLLDSPKDGFVLRKTSEGGILYHMRRHYQDGDLVFLVNSSIEAALTCELQSQAGTLENWNLETGEAGLDLPYRSEEGTLKATLELPACGSLLVFLSPEARPSLAEIRAKATSETLDGPFEVHAGDNVLTLDYVDVEVGGERLENAYFYQASELVFKKHGFDRDPWDHAIQYKDEWLKKTFPEDSGFTATYRFRIEEKVPAKLDFVLERADLYEIECNGKPVSLGDKEDWWLDKAFPRFDIRPLAQVGENRLTIRARPFNLFHEIEPAYVVGDFMLRSVEKGFAIAPSKPLGLGPWNEQGRPLYGADARYTTTFEVESLEGRTQVALGKWLGALAEVRVNGELAGSLWHRPWECEVTSLLKPGKNTLEIRVFGTLKNTLGPHHGNPPLGFAGPGSFRNGPAPGPPAGSEYSTVGYGLFEPPVLLRD